MVPKLEKRRSIVSFLRFAIQAMPSLHLIAHILKDTNVNLENVA